MAAEQDAPTDEEQSEKVILDSGEVWTLPGSLNVPEGTSYFLGADDGHCRAITPAKGRCQGVRIRAIGLCGGHAGTSRILDDPREMQRRGTRGKARLRERHSLLVSNGITPRRAAKAAAIRRTDAIVRALVDDPLDDPDLGTIPRQRAVIGMLDAVFPLATVTAEIELPTDPDAVESMGWSEMQALAARMLPELEAGTG
jgi:hypothetical protein